MAGTEWIKQTVPCVWWPLKETCSVLEMFSGGSTVSGSLCCDSFPPQTRQLVWQTGDGVWLGWISECPLMAGNWCLSRYDLRIAGRRCSSAIACLLRPDAGNISWKPGMHVLLKKCILLSSPASRRVLGYRFSDWIMPVCCFPCFCCRSFRLAVSWVPKHPPSLLQDSLASICAREHEQQLVTRKCWRLRVPREPAPPPLSLQSLTSVRRSRGRFPASIGLNRNTDGEQQGSSRTERGAGL